MSPQIENGYIKIANELFEAFYRCKLSEYERIFILCVWRKTYGFNKKEDILSLQQIQKQTGIKTKHISRVINQLIEKNILVYKGEKKSINKNYKEWKVEWRVLPTQGVGVLPVQGQGTPCTGIYKRQYTKDNIKDKEKQVSHSLSPTISRKKKYNKSMKKNSFKHNENMHQDEFETSIDYDSREELNPEPKKKVRKDQDVIELQKAFIEICEMETGFKPIKDAKGYMAVRNALKYLKYEEVIDKYEQWFKVSGRPKEDLIALTKCLSNDQLNKFRLQKEQG